MVFILNYLFYPAAPNHVLYFHHIDRKLIVIAKISIALTIPLYNLNFPVDRNTQLYTLSETDVNPRSLLQVFLNQNKWYSISFTPTTSKTPYTITTIVQFMREIFHF